MNILIQVLYNIFCRIPFPLASSILDFIKMCGYLCFSALLSVYAYYLCDREPRSAGQPPGAAPLGECAARLRCAA